MGKSRKLYCKYRLCNINDVLKLMYKMYNEVKVRYTIELRPEIKFFGIADEDEKEIWQTMTEN